MPSNCSFLCIRTNEHCTANAESLFFTKLFPFILLNDSVVINKLMLILYFRPWTILIIFFPDQTGQTRGGGGGDALNFCFGGYVLHGLPKVGSREWLFLEK